MGCWSPAWVYVAFIVNVFSQRIVAWHASTCKATDLVMTPLRMAVWQRHHKADEFGTGPYLFAGPVAYVQHVGERPIAITWRLCHPLPNDFFSAPTVAAG